MLLRLQTIPLLFSTFSLVYSQDNLGLNNGYTKFQVGTLEGQIVKSSQTLASLNSSRSGFDFLPFDFLPQLAFNGAHHLGDITIRYRTAGSEKWTSIDSATARKSVTALDDLGTNVIAAANLLPTLPSGLPLNVTREWLKHGDDLVMRFNITNTATTTVELGSLGLPISINNIFTGRSAEDTQAKCSLADPYIGLDAGYVRVTHLQGTGNALVITPLGSTPFEAWRFLHEPSGAFGYQSQTFEGNYEWQVHSLAWAQNEWNSSVPWNTPTSKKLQPGEEYSVGLRFSIADDVQHIEEAVVRTGTPLAVGIPGYVVPSDSTARLYLNHLSPIKNVDAGGAFTVSKLLSSNTAYKLTPTPSSWGRARVTISYEDGKTQTVHYYITKSAVSALADLGHFFTTSAHYTNTSDPFNRAPSIMTYDREANKVVEQDSRVWIAGLSDEGGTGAYLATAMKQFAQPVANEVSILDEFVHETVVGTLQQNGSFSVVASAFYYEPSAVNFTYDTTLDWGSWTSWNRARAYTTRRAYNYIHPTATYWALYRVARNYPEQKLRADWSWYLGRAVNTTQYCLANKAVNCDYGLVGLMGEWVLGELLEDLKREDMTAEASALEASMRYRANLWETQAVPFGSEMAWDSTGQEGVYYWTKYNLPSQHHLQPPTYKSSSYFNLPTTPPKVINSILAYMPAVAHWGWNGNARRYWDFLYGAKIQQIERQIHHYGSGLNSLPMLHSYEQKPHNNIYALRVGFAGNTAPLTNIDQDGFASAALHSYPELLKWDPYSGDYGQGFLGLSLGQCVYVLRDEQFGDLVFGGDIVDVDGGDSYSNTTNITTTTTTTTSLVIAPKDAIRKRVFIADLGLKIEISAGAIQSVVYDRTAQSVTLTLVPAATSGGMKAREAIVWLKERGDGTLGFTVLGAGRERGGWVVDLTGGRETVGIVRV
ncbi:Nn.00g074610.m01.CDS01 [Neocucurbitaria sp. VM-36]